MKDEIEAGRNCAIGQTEITNRSATEELFINYKKKQKM
jgi:hypothetical protein